MKLLLLILLEIASAQGLKVYMSDGTTVLGNYLGCGSEPSYDPAKCNSNSSGVMYANVTTGVVTKIGLDSYATQASLFFASAGCIGTPYMQYTAGLIYNNGTIYNVNSYAGNFTVNSYRTWNGSCINSSSTIALYFVNSGLSAPCGYGPCVIKP